ncbi:MAG: butyryl-CoA:acetate CoA-transferase [Syntrophomonadaceae bacterium]|nr:butyryl-CoA:acetate CoA-transferase [Syntrophomonadaceae bacterium]
MDPREMYQRKLILASVAAGIVNSGDWIDYGVGASHPVAFDQALAARARDLRDVKIRGAFTLWMPAIFQVEDPGEHFCWNSWHYTAVDRKILDMGCGFHSPMSFFELPRYYAENLDPVSVAVCQVAPMDGDGYFSFGTSPSYQAAVFAQSEIRIVEVNNNMPRTRGSSNVAIHISQVDFVIEGPNGDLAEIEPSEPDNVDRRVANLILEEIPDGACLQLGIGRMPNAVGSLIADSDLKDLGVHTETYVNAYMDIASRGKINGLKKSIDRGRQVFSYVLGSRQLYEFVNENPDLMATTIDYSNDPRVIAQLDNFISINNAVEIDLFGQVSAESNGLKQISGTGGYLGFVMGAYWSKGGKSIVCLASTYGRGQQTKSRVVSTLSQGTITTGHRTLAHWVVTEFGKANLKGMSTWQRAETLIGLSHPDYRQDLISDADRMGIWRRSNK